MNPFDVRETRPADHEIAKLAAIGLMVNNLPAQGVNLDAKKWVVRLRSSNGCVVLQQLSAEHAAQLNGDCYDHPFEALAAFYDVDLSIFAPPQADGESKPA